MKTSSIFIVLLAFSVLFSNCKKDNNPDCLQGNGDLVQDTRTVGEFNDVVANGAFNISFSQTSNTGVDLFGDSNILPIITTVTSNKVLTISVQNDQCYSTQNNIEVTLASPEFYSVTLNGAGKIEGFNLITDDLLYETNGSATINSSFEVTKLQTIIKGSGNANFSGSATSAYFSISGTGNILASTVETDSCNINITGVGDIRIQVNDFLEVTISGSGNVYYSGNPGTINQYITGTGQLIKEG